MSFLYEKVIAKALYTLDPETAHQLGLRGMGLLGACAPLRLLMERSLTPQGGRPIEAFGLKFPNHIGLAAGFDKDGIGWRGAAALGFGHVEVGTVTPKAQPGNEKPRVFRYPELNAVVNAYGFPNNGAQALHDRLSKQPGRGQRVCPLGINIGKNKATANEQAHEDYLACFKLLAPLADYVAVNISSPNTTGLRALQDRAPLVTLLSALAQENRSVAGGPVPLLLKIAPDLNPNQLADIVSVVGECGFAGIIATNTTTTRPAGTETCSPGRGGLSGAPSSNAPYRWSASSPRKPTDASPSLAAAASCPPRTPVASWMKAPASCRSTPASSSAARNSPAKSPKASPGASAPGPDHFAGATGMCTSDCLKKNGTNGLFQ